MEVGSTFHISEGGAKHEIGNDVEGEVVGPGLEIKINSTAAVLDLSQECLLEIEDLSAHVRFKGAHGALVQCWHDFFSATGVEGDVAG